VHLLADSAGSGAGAAAGLIFIILGVGFWFLPTIIAAVRHLPNTVSTFLVNLIPVAGFFIALIYAVRSQPKPQYVVPPGWGPQQQMPPPGFQPPSPQPQAGLPPQEPWRQGPAQ